jgi:cytochrome c biogenesis protein CcmG/thiol:disulfide interchange protein DsbE
MSSPRNRNVIIAIAVAVVVVIAAVIAIVVSGGDDNGSSSNNTSPSGVVLKETQSVDIDGDSLDPLDIPENDTTIGLTPPTLRGSSFDGTSVVVEPGESGRPIMVVFLAHWCPHCNAEIPILIEWKNSGGVPSNLDVIGVSTAVFDDRDNYPPSRWISDTKFPWPVMADNENSDAAISYGVAGFPSFVLIDEAGAVMYRADGQKSLAELTAIMDTFFPAT